MQHLNIKSGWKSWYKKMKAQKRLLDTPPEYAKRSLLDKHGNFAATEAYKAARTNLLFTRVADGCQILAFTSTFQREGKTVTCCNLAMSVAENGQKVLLIDADMRRPQIANMFDIPNKSGLSECLAGMLVLDEKGKPRDMPYVQTKYPNLAIIPSGHIPPNPAELLASERMKVLLEVASQHFDYIFIDAPPVSVVTDAAVLANVVHGYVLVVRAGMTPMESLRSVVLKMEQFGAHILGFVLNDLDAKSGSYKYSGYSYNKYKYHQGYRNYYSQAAPNERR
ncbi:MAG: CpsD/CapB family tyrosine-protein kinase [Oscillospiraceae bacterium]